MKYILILGLALILVACGQSNNEKSIEVKNSVIQTTQKRYNVVTIKENPKTVHKSDFEGLLKDPKTPKMAVELYKNKYQMKNDNEPLELFDYLERGSIIERMFYFKAITNTYFISDGAYSEGLGYYGKKYIEKRTCLFASYFDNEECFSNKDLDVWVNIVVGELEIEGEIETGKYDKTIVVEFNKKLKENCKSATTNQKATIEKFCKQLDEKYNSYIKRQ